jgi:hypothetical protein
MVENVGVMMLTYTEKLLGMKIDGQSQRHLTARSYAKLKADEFVLGPPESWQDEYLIRDCSFKDCEIEPGALLILGGVELRNVVFDNMRARDHFTIYTDALFDNVTIRGNSKSAGLWIKPNEPGDLGSVDKRLSHRMESMASKVETMLDISEFFGEVNEILGLPVNKVKIDNARHVIIRQAMKAEFEKRGVLKNMFWRILFSRLPLFGVEAGIFDVPSPKEEAEAFRQFELLKKDGVF